jgi:hypothetical protein
VHDDGNYAKMPFHPGWLSALNVFNSKSILYVAFVRARRARNSPNRRFPARAVRAGRGHLTAQVTAQWHAPQEYPTEDFVDRRTFFVVMPYFSGGTLKGLLAEVAGYALKPSEVAAAPGGTVIPLSLTTLTVIGCRSLGIHSVILLSLLSFSAKMTVSPLARSRATSPNSWTR